MIRDASPVDLMLGDTPPQVWSLLVTVFGDLAQAQGTELSAALLGRLTGAMGVRPEATRVALHRLRKDGWIDSRRVGRRSLYRLTPDGRRQTLAASPRIYDTGPPPAGAWLCLADPSGPVPAGIGIVPTAPHVTVAAARPASPDIAAFPLSGPLPAWLRAQLLPEGVVTASRDLRDSLQALADALADNPPDDPLQVAVLRVLVVHGWRRLILKVPALPDAVFPDEARIDAARALKQSLLQALPPPSLPALEQFTLASAQ
ncbi:MAG: PaaX family transcriptional regulator C-terminal domain-containing protein [Pseudomonadota bacterium]